MSDKMIIHVEQNPGIVRFDNYEQIKAALQDKVEFYNKVDYSRESMDIIRSDYKELDNLKKDINKVKREMEKAYKAPLEEVNIKLKELLEIIGEPWGILKEIVDETDDREKTEAIMAYAKDKAVVLGSYADKIINSKAFFNPKWLNKTCKPNEWQSNVDDIVNNAIDDINTINTYDEDKKSFLLARYYETLTLDGMEEFLKDSEQKTDENLDATSDAIIGYKVLKIFGNERQIMNLLMELELRDMDYEEIEDGMPSEMTELQDPDFDSFVAFDIEHTGTYGVEKGDSEAEIIEIGAVKVVDGKVESKFSELANPGRKIIPRVSKITGITNEMVADMPSVEDVITRFKDFVGDAILVGHSIKGCDIPHIQRAAKKAGFMFNNKYLDTVALARKTFKNNEVENKKLATLAEYYRIEQETAHRAWCDAEVTAQLYLRLKEEK